MGWARRVPRRGTAAVAGLGIACAVLLAAGCRHEAAGGAGFAAYVETGDLPALERHGYLRILAPPSQPRTLPRRSPTIDADLKVARDLAAHLGLEPVVVTLRARDRLLPALVEGRGDLVVARLTATEERRARYAFSVPLAQVREMLAVRAADDRMRSRADLAGKRVAVRRSSSFWDTLQRLRKEVPGIVVVAADESLDTEELIYRVSEGEFDATVADEDLLAEVASYLDVRAAFALTRERPIAWAMRPGNSVLKHAVDAFLHKRALADVTDAVAVGDLGTIRERGVLRVLTRNNAATYFLYRGRQMGFEFELARDFAKSIGCRVQIVVPPKADQLIPWLLDGRGDVIAAAMTVTPDRSARVAFSRPYNRVSEMVVVHAGEDDVRGPRDLTGRSVLVRRSSSYHESLEELRRTVDVGIIEAPEEVETEQLIAWVANGLYDITIADSNIVDIELTYRDDVKPAFALGDPKDIAWAVRPGDVELLGAIDAYFDRIYRGTFYNVLQKKYFRSKRNVSRFARARPVRAGKLSPFDEAFRRVGREVEIDWRLLVAVGFQESGFDPTATSWAGAVGLMQTMPQTAEDLGVEGDLRDPDVAIEAGGRYLRRLMDRFEPALPFGERVRFALASYNAGHGHVHDGRRLAVALGYDPDVWFDNVERAIPLLARESYASKARFGYCRCSETRDYVRQVNQRYLAYSRVLE